MRVHGVCICDVRIDVSSICMHVCVIVNVYMCECVFMYMYVSYARLISSCSQLDW